MNILTSQVLQNLLVETIHCSKDEIALNLINRGTNTEVLLKTAMANNDMSLINYLTANDEHLLQEDF